MITANMFSATIMPQITHNTTRCHLWAVMPMSRTSNVKADSFPNVVETIDKLGAITVYLIAFARSSLS